MRIAYLIHGHVRTWKECYKNFFDNIYSVVPGDIYIHTWDRVNSKVGSWWNGTHNRLSGELERLSAEPVDKNELIQIYNPKEIIVETDTGTDYLINNYDHVYESSLAVKNLLRGHYDLFNLTKKFGTYDKYFVTRFDINFLSKIEETEFYYDEVVIPTTGHSKDPLTFILDLWKITNQNQLETLSNYYHEIDSYWYQRFNYGHYVYEQALAEYYKDNNILTRYSPVKFNIPRINGDIYDCQ